MHLKHFYQKKIFFLNFFFSKILSNFILFYFILKKNFEKFCDEQCS